MKIVALLSGGKDSIYNLIECIGMGHELVCVANLHPPQSPDGATEIDSFMYQSVGVEIVPYIAQCLGVPIVQCEIKGKSLNQDLYYEKVEEEKQEETDEVEDLFNLLSEVKANYPEVQAVASGAILSNYQRLRVENCCQRLGLVSLAYLWNRDQSELLDEMIKNCMQVHIVKICSIGLKHEHLGMTITELREYFHHLRDKFDFNVCGEGGEYESAVFDCPLFKTHKLVAKTQKIVSHDDNQECPVAYLAYADMEVVEKSEEEKQQSADLIAALVQYRQSVSHQGLLNIAPVLPDPLDESKFAYHAEPIVLNKIQLSVSIIDPTLTGEQIKAMNQKDQLLMIFQHLKTMNVIPYIIKVALLVTDLSQFKPLNAEYVKEFGLRPPVRVCVQVPSDEVIFIATVWNNKGKDDEETLGKFKAMQNNMHVQSVSFWAPPNVGPYSQINKFDNVLFMAGQICLYPPALALVDPADLQLQYAQTKKNYTSCLQKICEGIVKDTSALSWQHFCKAATIFIPATVDVTPLLNTFRDDFQFMAGNLLLVRVNALPLGSSIEIEMICDSARVESDKLDKLWSNWSYQRFYTNLEEYENAPMDNPNVYGEVYYVQDQVTRDQIATLRGKKVAEDAPQTNILGTTGIIPALEIIDVFAGKQMAICERYLVHA